VTSLLVLPQVVLLGGAFPITSSGPSYRAIALDPVTGAVLPWLPVLAADPPGPYTSLDKSVTADRLFVVGFFETIDGQPRSRQAAFDLVRWTAERARRPAGDHVGPHRHAHLAAAVWRGTGDTLCGGAGIGPGSPATLARVTSTTFSGSGPAGDYAVAVRAENACGTSAATPPASVTLRSSMR